MMGCRLAGNSVCCCNGYFLMELPQMGNSMHCPNLTELPPPPSGKKGWPWTEATPRLPDTMPDGPPWPRISIVTPSLNQGRYIEETIRSVLLQGYPDLEYIIIDGGSTDNSLEVIQKYAPWLTYWVSEPDKGQSHAINKGWRHSTGGFIGWLCADDILLPSAVVSSALYWCAARGYDGSWRLSCDQPAELSIWHDADSLTGSTLVKAVSLCIAIAWQPGSLMRRSVLEKIGWLDETLHVGMDSDYFLRLALVGGFYRIPVVLATYRCMIKAKRFRI